jgi:hypothetical protein
MLNDRSTQIRPSWITRDLTFGFLGSPHSALNVAASTDAPSAQGVGSLSRSMKVDLEVVQHLYGPGMFGLSCGFSGN